MGSVKVHRADDGGCCVVEVEGELDLEMVEVVKPQVAAMLESGCGNVVLDLSRVVYVDSSALGLIVWLNDMVSPFGGRVIAAGADHNVSRILEISGLLAVAPTISAAPTAEDALMSLSIAEAESEPEWSETFEAPADITELTGLRTRVVDLVEPLGMSDQAVFDLKVAVGEALANAVRHGSPRGELDRVTVTVVAYPDRVAIDVADQGAGFDVSALCGPDLYSPCGRGVLFMHALTDIVEFRSGERGGTIVRLVKHLRRPEG